MTSRVHYPDVKTARCGQCAGFGCDTCRHDGHVPYCSGCGDEVENDKAFDANVDFLGTHGGFCAGCVGELEQADTDRPLLDHESSDRMFVDDPDLEVNASYDASPRTSFGSDPIAAAMLDVVSARMPKRAS